MDQNMPPSYSFSMLDMVTLDDAISYTFMCRNKRFIVDVSAESLGGEGELVDQFYKFKDDIDDPDIFSDFETWAIDAVDEHIKRLAPAASQTPTTLLEYYGAETFVFELVNRNGMLKAIEHSYDPEIHGDTSPKVIIVDSETRNAESTDGKAIIHRSVIPTVPLLPASQLARSAGPESMEEEMCEVPRNVQMIKTDQEYFFKAAYDGHGFQREVEVLAKIQNLAKDGLNLATSRIAGLVYWDGQETVLMGMLLERIDGPTLADARGHASAADGKKWIDQIDETVKKLHEHGLVWGDVKPENVMISPSGDAILIDFGGGCTPEYIDLELQETMEGDLQGIKRMREMLRKL
ncbi:hypothetical protein ACQKWADRAFT_285285 [Trichoderma austrokoningii]